MVPYFNPLHITFQCGQISSAWLSTAGGGKIFCIALQNGRQQILKRVECQKEIVHALKTAACAVPRTIICILENCPKDGFFPEPLRPTMVGLEQLQNPARWLSYYCTYITFVARNWYFAVVNLWYARWIICCMLENLLQEGGLIIIFCSSAMGGHSWKGLRVLLQNLANILVPIIFICCFGSCIHWANYWGYTKSCC